MNIKEEKPSTPQSTSPQSTQPTATSTTAVRPFRKYSLKNIF